LTLGVAIAGFADAHAAAASVASLVASGRLPAHDAVVPILAALSTNAVSKTVMSITSGGARFAIPVVSGVAIQMAAAWGVAIMHFG